MSTTINMPYIGLPDGVKEQGKRVDFKSNDFKMLIETKGYLLLWQRSAICPCAPVSDKTEQPDPNCDLCNGSGWFYFGPEENQSLPEYDLTELQTKMWEDSGGSIIRGIVTAIGSDPDPVDVISNWVHGTAYLTVRNENRLGYYDRITLLDSEIVFSERIKCNGTNILETRYPVVGINDLRSTTSQYKNEVHFDIEEGVVIWRADSIPSEDTYVGIHYLCHPTYLVIVHPHASRLTLTKFKTANPKTPLGSAVQLPVQAMIRYEFLPEAQ